jgi:DNA repair exonuclease SbcCD ATPase subunit
MGLRLKQIRLKNWKCYREQKIQFNLNTDKNIWIVFGQNGYGKTSLLEAILWCLYGNEGISTKKLPEYFNRNALKKRKPIDLSVQLNFEENGKYYFISREATLNWRGITPIAEVGEPTFNEDGKQRNNPREYIDSILPKSCKEFFFFDGVEIQRYAQLTQTDETKNAIEQILGIPELKNLRDDADKALKQIEKDLNKASAANQLLKIRKSLEELAGLENLSQEIIQQNNIQTQLSKLLRDRTLDLDEILLKRDRLVDDIDELQQSIDAIKQDTKGFKRSEVEETWRKLGAEEKNVENTRERINRLSKELDQEKQEEVRLLQEIETLGGQDKETATLVKQMKLAQGLRDAANELIEWYIGDRKQTIEHTTSQIHAQVTNKPDEYRGVAIAEGDNYSLRVKTVTGELLNPESLSAGEKEALAFAFITGLNIASETAAPLIMDTPFGHLDIQHQKNIVNALPNIPSQVIVLATDRDFQGDLLQELRPHVAEILHIWRDADEDMSIVEVQE